MIKVNNLTKKYGSFTALNDISFVVNKGETVGFLGANGAGKTTAMRIITGFISADNGEVKVSGNIGYLPENVPLYFDMRVCEYLLFRAKIKGLDSAGAKKDVGEVVEKCWIGDVRDKIIGQLSKGYRQRVGLADALLNKPEILVLDEPTVGLDPKQIIKVRDLIKELSKDFTIFLSSHILPEVEMVCNKIIIIHNGEIVAQDTPDKLRSDFIKSGNIYVEIRSDQEDDVRKELSSILHVGSIELINKKRGFLNFKITTKKGKDVRENIFKVVSKAGWSIRDLRYEKTSLEDVFMQITTKEV